MKAQVRNNKIVALGNIGDGPETFEVDECILPQYPEEIGQGVNDCEVFKGTVITERNIIIEWIPPIES